MHVLLSLTLQQAQAQSPSRAVALEALEQDLFELQVLFYCDLLHQANPHPLLAWIGSLSFSLSCQDCTTSHSVCRGD